MCVCLISVQQDSQLQGSMCTYGRRPTSCCAWPCAEPGQAQRIQANIITGTPIICQ